MHTLYPPTRLTEWASVILSGYPYGLCSRGYNYGYAIAHDQWASVILKGAMVVHFQRAIVILIRGAMGILMCNPVFLIPLTLTLPLIAALPRTLSGTESVSAPTEVTSRCVPEQR